MINRCINCHSTITYTCSLASYQRSIGDSISGMLLVTIVVGPAKINHKCVCVCREGGHETAQLMHAIKQECTYGHWEVLHYTIFPQKILKRAHKHRPKSPTLSKTIYIYLKLKQSNPDKVPPWRAFSLTS